MMKTRCSSSLILMMMLTLSSNLVAQENREPEHACFGLEDTRVFPLEMKVQQSDSNLFRSEFLFMTGWSGKQVFVRVPAMKIPYSIRINGFRFGSDPGSGIASEYNITPFLRKKSNTLELMAGLTAKQNESATIIQGSLLIRDAILTRNMVITTHAGVVETEVLVRFHLFLKSYLREKNLGRTIQLKIAFNWYSLQRSWLQSCPNSPSPSLLQSLRSLESMPSSERPPCHAPRRSFF